MQIVISVFGYFIIISPVGSKLHVVSLESKWNELYSEFNSILSKV